MDFIGFADAKQFVSISGISRDDLETKVYPNKDFKKHVCTVLVKVTNDISKSDQQLSI